MHQKKFLLKTYTVGVKDEISLTLRTFAQNIFFLLLVVEKSFLKLLFRGLLYCIVFLNFTISIVAQHHMFTYTHTHIQLISQSSKSFPFHSLCVFKSQRNISNINKNNDNNLARYREIPIDPSGSRKFGGLMLK